MYIYLYICSYMRIYLFMYIYWYVFCVCVYIYIYMYMLIYLYIYVYTFTYAWTYIYIYICSYICIYIYIYIYIYINVLNQKCSVLCWKDVEQYHSISTVKHETTKTSWWLNNTLHFVNKRYFFWKWVKLCLINRIIWTIYHCLQLLDLLALVIWQVVK